MQQRIAPATRCQGDIVLPGDKSISHRGLILGALAEGITELVRPLEAEDTHATVRVLRQLGAQVLCGHTARGTGAAPVPVWSIQGMGAGPLPDEGMPRLDCGNSGTTLRLLLGALAGCGRGATFVGDASLSRRPMARVVRPLQQMGAQVQASAAGTPPVQLQPSAARARASAPLVAIDYTLPMASAQVKSALLLAALGAHGRTVLRGQLGGRDHTEKMLAAFSAQVQHVGRGDGAQLCLQGPQRLRGTRLVVPGDPSSAAFFWAAAAMVPQGSVCTHGVSLNPTRLGFLRLLQRMGAQVRITPQGLDAEPRGSVSVHHAPLTGCTVTAAEVPAMIDELPLVAVVATQARGITQVRGAAELRHKESDRIEAMAHNLAAMGTTMHRHEDGFDVAGPQPLHGATLSGFADHRIAMACAIAALVADGASAIEGADCVAVSYPHFFAELTRLTCAVAAKD